jgi:rhamnosyltransferase
MQMSHILNDCPTKNDICAVITTYRPDNQFYERVERVRVQVGLIVIVDDGACEGNLSLLVKWFPKSDKVIVHHNLVNSGVAASLNTGIAIGKERGFKWILTLDDDSSIAPQTVEKLIHALKTIKTRKPIGIIGMSWTDRGTAYKDNPSGDHQEGYAVKRGIITSGSLFAMTTFEEAGPFREDFFIDMVDYEFCLRVRTKGFLVIKLDEIGFDHSLGSGTVRHLFGMKVMISSHDPTRLYYRVRNAWVLILECFKNDPLLAMALAFGNIQIIYRLLLFEKNKSEKLLNVLIGIKDGFMGQSGPKRRGGI